MHEGVGYKWALNPVSLNPKTSDAVKKAIYCQKYEPFFEPRLFMATNQEYQTPLQNID